MRHHIVRPAVTATAVLIPMNRSIGEAKAFLKSM